MPPEKQHNYFSKKKRSTPREQLPSGYSSNSSATYYNLANAQAVQKHLDTLDPNNKTKEILFRVDRFKSINTIYQQIYLGWRFLIEKLDTPDKKYAYLKSQMSLKRGKDSVKLVWSSKSVPTVN